MTAYSFVQHRITGGNGADDPFWEGLEDGVLQLPRCTGCGRWTWPAHFRCGHCGAWEFAWTRLEPRARVFSWTRTCYAFDRVLERAGDVPYVSVVAELPEAGGARVIGVLDGPEAALRVDAPLTGVIMPPSPKTKHYPSMLWRLD